MRNYHTDIFIAPDGRPVIVPAKDRTKGVVKYHYVGSSDNGACETREFLRTFKPRHEMRRAE